MWHHTFAHPSFPPSPSLSLCQDSFLWLSWNPLYRPGWPSTSLVLGLEVWPPLFFISFWFYMCMCTLAHRYTGCTAVHLWRSEDKFVELWSFGFWDQIHELACLIWRAVKVKDVWNTGVGRQKFTKMVTCFNIHYRDMHVDIYSQGSLCAIMASFHRLTNFFFFFRCD